MVGNICFDLMSLPPVILASASPRRSELLREAGLEFRVVPSDASEVDHESLTAREVAQVNAYRKARVVAKKYPDALVLGADTLVYLGTEFFGKPRSVEDAGRMLNQLQGRTHEVVTAVCLLHLRDHRQQILVAVTDVTFRTLDFSQIEHYLAQVDPLDKAGAYAIQERGDLIVEKVAGSYSNVVGLPMEQLREALSAWSVTNK